MAPKQSFVDLAAIAQALLADYNLTENSKLYDRRQDRADLLLGNVEHSNYSFSTQDAEAYLKIFTALVKGDTTQVREIVAAPLRAKPVTESPSPAMVELEAAAREGRSYQIFTILAQMAQDQTYPDDSVILKAMRVAKDNLHDHTHIVLGCHRTVPAGRLVALERAAKKSYWDLVSKFANTVPLASLTRVFHLAQRAANAGDAAAAEVFNLLTTAGLTVPVVPIKEVKPAESVVSDNTKSLIKRMRRKNRRQNGQPAWTVPVASPFNNVIA